MAKQMTITDLFAPREVEVKGLLDDGYCPNCNACLDDLIEQCPYCATFLSWEYWKQVNDWEDDRK